MSSFIVENKTINVIVTFFARHDEFRRQFFTDHFDPKTLGNAMYDLNLRAVDARYGSGQGVQMAGDDGYHYSSYSAEPLEVYKRICCYLYRCSEGDIPETSRLYQTLERMRYYLADKLIRSMPGYDAIPWE